jgi:hypothetical protein
MNLNITQLGLFIVIGLIGMYAHWYKKAKRGELHGRFVDYLVADCPGSTMATLAVFLGASFTAASSGAISGLDLAVATDLLRHGQLHTPTISVLGSGFMMGWTLDSGINKGGA